MTTHFPLCPVCRRHRNNQLRYKRSYYQRNAEAIREKKRAYMAERRAKLRALSLSTSTPTPTPYETTGA